MKLMQSCLSSRKFSCKSLSKQQKYKFTSLTLISAYNGTNHTFIIIFSWETTLWLPQVHECWWCECPKRDSAYNQRHFCPDTKTQVFMHVPRIKIKISNWHMTTYDIWQHDKQSVLSLDMCGRLANLT